MSLLKEPNRLKSTLLYTANQSSLASPAARVNELAPQILLPDFKHCDLWTEEKLAEAQRDIQQIFLRKQLLHLLSMQNEPEECGSSGILSVSQADHFEKLACQAWLFLARNFANQWLIKLAHKIARFQTTRENGSFDTSRVLGVNNSKNVVSWRLWKHSPDFENRLRFPGMKYSLKFLFLKIS